jgi:hypothetical protein
MIDDKIIVSNQTPRVVDSLIETNISVEELESFKTLKSIDLDIEQAEYL